MNFAKTLFFVLNMFKNARGNYRIEGPVAKGNGIWTLANDFQSMLFDDWVVSPTGPDVTAESVVLAGKKPFDQFAVTAAEIKDFDLRRIGKTAKLLSCYRKERGCFFRFSLPHF